MKTIMSSAMTTIIAVIKDIIVHMFLINSIFTKLYCGENNNHELNGIHNRKG